MSFAESEIQPAAKDQSMNERDQIYVQILHHGLLRLREAAHMSLNSYCEVEADHLHNLPSLIGETNELRHVYYFEQERTLYLQRVDRSVPGIEFTLNRYRELWEELAKITDAADKPTSEQE